MLGAVLKHLADDRPAALNRLKEFLAIPSISTDSAYAADVRGGADWIVAALRQAGFDATAHETNGHPVVVGSAGPKGDQPGALYYGHYDVQPPDPVESWISPPFEPTVRDGAVFARGACDDKGQICCILEALRAWKQVHDDVPLPITVLFEGEEECGSRNLPAFVEGNRSLLDVGGDGRGVAVISDTNMWESPDGPLVAITYGLRGMVYYDVELHGPTRDLHSGMYGGTLANPATILTKVLGGLFDDDRRVTIPGFYDDVAPPDEEEQLRWNQLQFDEKNFLGAVGVGEGFGEKGFDLLARRWARPSCDINGLYGGYGGEGAKTIIPGFAGAKVSFRLVPNQTPETIAQSFETWVRSHEVPGCTWKLTSHGQATPVVVPTDSPHLAAAVRAVETSAAHRPVLIREGGTIPVVHDFKKTLGLDTLLIGFGRMDDCVHAPNEKFNLHSFELGCRTHAALISELAKM